MTSSVDSFIVLIFIVSLGVSLSVAQWTSKSDELFAIILIIKSAISLLMVVSGSFGIWLKLRPPHFKVQTERTITQNQDDDLNTWTGSCWLRFKTAAWMTSRNIRRMFKYHVALVGLLVFCVPGLIVDFLKAVSICNCFLEYTGIYLKWYTADFLYHLCRMYFLIVLLVCCYSFHDARFSSCRRVWYTLTLLMSTAIIVGADVFLHEILNGLSDRHISHPNNPLHNTSEACIAGHTKLFTAYHWSSEVFYSLNVEFVVLASEVLVHIMLNIRRGGADTSPSTSSMPSFSDFQSVSIEEQSTTRRLSRGFKAILVAIFLFVLVMNLAHIVSAILTAYSIYTPFRVSRVVFHTLLLSTVFVGFWSSSHLPKSQRPFSGFERLVLFSFTGNLIWSLMNLGGEVIWCITYDSHNSSIPLVSVWSGIIGNMLNVVTILAQVKFMMRASRIRPPKQQGKKYAIFKALLLAIGFSNLTLWCVNSFVLNKNVTATLVPFKYYSKSSWIIIVHLTVPLCLFFRFNSFAMYIKAFFTQEYSLNTDAITASELDTEHNSQLTIACTQASNDNVSN